MTFTALETLAERRFVSGNRVGLFRSGPEYFPAIFDALIAARRAICVEMYAIWDGEICSRLGGILKDRAAAGISVRVIADAVGSRAWSKAAIEDLRRAGATVFLHNPISIRRLNRLGLRTHRKLIIVDSTVAFAGGFNFVDVFDATASQAPWLDYVVGMKGPIVAEAQATFERSWRREGASGISPYAETPSPDGSGFSEVLLIDSPVPSGMRSVRAMHEVALASARHLVSIRNPFFLPDEGMLRTIADAVERGVVVRVIVPGARMAHRVLLDANRHRYGALLTSGARLFEFETSMMHAKTMVVDGALSLVGSANFDARSIACNDELTVAIFDHSFASSMEACFEADLANCAEIGQGDVAILTSGRLRRILVTSLMRFF
jgi:cardiolipin synthase